MKSEIRTLLTPEQIQQSMDLQAKRDSSQGKTRSLAAHDMDKGK